MLNLFLNLLVILNYMIQMMWHLVRSSWILHVSCKKRRVAPIAALLSSVLHCSVFGDEKMHVANSEPGPLKWVCGLSLSLSLSLLLRARPHVHVLITYRILANDILYFFQFIENVIEEGKKSPRTIRLAALHLTGLWLSNPRTIKYYMKELKLLSLYGSGVLHGIFFFFTHYFHNCLVILALSYTITSQL
jgi:tRNA guanosine-2'-O-methyltransferase